jgi:hypothetical protein
VAATSHRMVIALGTNQGEACFGASARVLSGKFVVVLETRGEGPSSYPGSVFCQIRPLRTPCYATRIVVPSKRLGSQHLSGARIVGFGRQFKAPRSGHIKEISRSANILLASYQTGVDWDRYQGQPTLVASRTSRIPARANNSFKLKPLRGSALFPRWTF